MHDVHNDYRQLLDGMQVRADYRAKIMGGTAAQLYGITGAG